jgi:hypothetical protein
VFRTQEEIYIVLDHFTEIYADRVVDGNIHYGGHTHPFPVSTLKERIMGEMYYSSLTWNYRQSHEYEAP